MTYEEKSEIVIRQLREDRDRLLDAMDKIRAEISNLNCEYIEYGDDYCGCDAYIKENDVLAIIDKYR